MLGTCDTKRGVQGLRALVMAVLMAILVAVLVFGL